VSRAASTPEVLELGLRLLDDRYTGRNVELA
jgi:hypothetical protein